MPATLEQQFQLLRARIENSLGSPCVLLISSATVGDGKSVCAQGLAESMIAAGHNTLLIDIDHNAPRLRALPQASKLSMKSVDREIQSAIAVETTGLKTLALSSGSLAATASKESVSQLISHLRSVFDVIVIEAGAILDSSIALLFASRCDAVILTAREGRSVRSRDRETLEALQRDGAKFFGVVTVSQRAIVNFSNVDVLSRTQHAPATGVNALQKIEKPIARMVL